MTGFGYERVQSEFLGGNNIKNKNSNRFAADIHRSLFILLLNCSHALILLLYMSKFTFRKVIIIILNLIQTNIFHTQA